MSKMRIEFEFETDLDGIDRAVALAKYAHKMGVTPVVQQTTPVPAPAPPPKTRPPAPAPAPLKTANSKAAPAPAKKPEPKQTDIQDFMGDDDEDTETGGLDLADEDDPQGFKGTAEDAKEEALARLRTMLGNGCKAEVKQVQQKMGVAKFHDVPVEQGYAFLNAVKTVEAKIAKTH